MSSQVGPPSLPHCRPPPWEGRETKGQRTEATQKWIVQFVVFVLFFWLWSNIVLLRKRCEKIWKLSRPSLGRLAARRASKLEGELPSDFFYARLAFGTCFAPCAGSFPECAPGLAELSSESEDHLQQEVPQTAGTTNPVKKNAKTLEVSKKTV